jgi:hypothetical protein
MGQCVRSQRQKVLARIMYKECLKGSIESNMEPTLGQRGKDETHNTIKHETTRLFPCKFYEPSEGKIDGFFTFRESKKM